MPIECFYNENELAGLGLKRYGKNVRISRRAVIYHPQTTAVGDNVRIDDFCIFTGDITVGSYIHIAPYCSLFGMYGIVMEDFSTLSSRVAVYSVSDDYLGNSMTNPMVPEEFRKFETGPVAIKKHAIIGAGSVILPAAVMEEGAAIGALSLVKGRIEPWSVYGGVPAKFIKKRKSEAIKQYEKELREKYF